MLPSASSPLTPKSVALGAGELYSSGADDQHNARPIIPDYEVLRLVGRGAYGEVWLARSTTSLYRAVKVIYRAAFDHDRPFEREFDGIQKFEPISHSESQVHILHVGRNVAAGCFYYVMELADDAEAEWKDGRLESWNVDQEEAAKPSSHHSIIPAFQDPNSYTPKTLKHELHARGRLPFEECVQIGLALTNALAHLHKNGLVHRDVKPSNIIFVNDLPKLADIGLVTSVDATRSFVGTEGYLAPEGPGTPQADLYSLGKVLYEISTGKSRREFPALPEDIATVADRHRLSELNAVIVKACQVAASERYQSAEEMQVDLGLLQRGKSVKRRRTAERRWAVVTKFSMLGALIALIVTGSFLLNRVVNKHQPERSGATPELEMKGTKNREAWNAYVEGQHYYTRVTPDGAQRAINSMKEAIRLDPKFAQPYAALAEIYHWWDDLFPSSQEALTKGREAALQALALDDSLVTAHIELAFGDWHLDRNFSKAEEGLKRAIQLSPDYARAHGMYGWLLLEMGRLEEAKEQHRLAQLFDPVSPRNCCGTACVFLSAGQLEEAVGQLRRALDLDPNFWWAFELLGEIHEEKGEFPEAIEMSRKAAVARGMEPEKTAQRSDDLRRAFSTGGARGYWQKKLELANGSSSLGADPYDIAVIYLHLGQKDSALEFLWKAEAQRGSDNAFRINFDRRFDSVRSDPQFLDLLRRLGLEK